MFKVDLHTHSLASPDGGINLAGYERALSSGLLDCIAITDHDRIDFALDAQKVLGNRIIVGEEIMTTGGEIIGLFLTESIPAGLAVAETISIIKAQNGIVYIPHPFETVRRGLHPRIMESLQDTIDIVEVCNGRAFLQNRSQQTVVWTKMNHLLGAASSDAHGYLGLGKTYSGLKAVPTRKNILELFSTAVLCTDRPAIRSLLYPSYNRLRKRRQKTS